MSDDSRGAPPPGEADDTDWTFVLDSGCPECGYRLHDPNTTAGRLEAAAKRWNVVLDREDVAVRPAERVWSPLEYASHSSDLIEVLGQRLTVMLEQDAPTFADYDGEAEAVRKRFWAADPREVARQINERTAGTARILRGIDDADLARTGYRGDGMEFTVTGLCRYLLHDVEHHLHDVSG